MKLSLGIVGLPNVGKSTLFRALTNQQVPAENYPFCTIDPNVGIVLVKDERINKITEIVKPGKTVPAIVEFVDIAGLVKGASEGEGLGNKFLSHIRETSAIVHLVRAFSDTNIQHVEESVDPARDHDIITTELVLKDIESLENRINSIGRKANNDKSLAAAKTHLELLLAELNDGKVVIDVPMPTDEAVIFERKQLQLLTDKPIMYLVNVEQENVEDAAEKFKKQIGTDKHVIAMDVKLEAEMIDMELEERQEFMEEFGMSKTGLEQLTKDAYDLLDLISYFTAGEIEVKAWTIKKNTKGPQAAAAIHTDFEKGFIAADVVSSENFIELGGWNPARDKGKVNLEGKEYIVKDGDVILFKINN